MKDEYIVLFGILWMAILISYDAVWGARIIGISLVLTIAFLAVGAVENKIKN